MEDGGWKGGKWKVEDGDVESKNQNNNHSTLNPRKYQHHSPLIIHCSLVDLEVIKPPRVP